MKNKKVFLVVSIVIVLSVVIGYFIEKNIKENERKKLEKEQENTVAKNIEEEQNNPLKIRMITSKGNIEAILFYKQVPNTVASFVSLIRSSFYTGMIFHRVIPDFIIQTGDPTSTGTGGPGYTVKDEIVKELSHDRAGILSMANAGADTNGSQFFITLGSQPHLDGKYTIFGEVVSGMDVVRKISTVKTIQDKPVSPVYLKKIEIVNGDWYKEDKVEKIMSKNQTDFENTASSYTKKLIENISEDMGMKKIESISIKYFDAVGSRVRVIYDVQYKDKKSSQVLFNGYLKDSKFEIIDFYFKKLDS